MLLTYTTIKVNYNNTTMDYTAPLLIMKHHFATGSTLPYAYRIALLRSFKQALLHHEQAIYEALYTDLKKSTEEVWVTEIGLVLTEINNAIRNLRCWMKPVRVRTNLLNFPSRSRIYSEPLGVVLIIAPWNYPLQLLLSPLVGAIAAGNCVALKPSEHAPATAEVMRLIVAQAFTTKDVYYYTGDGATVIPALMHHYTFDHVLYTGSIAVGKLIYAMAAPNLVPVTLELGGKSPCIITSHAQLKVAAKRIATAKYTNCGQICVAPDYILIHESQVSAFIPLLISAIQAQYTTNPATCSNYGSIINQAQYTRLLTYLQQGTIVHGGSYNQATLYLEPTLLTQVSMDSPIMQDEIFGPILPILTYNTNEEAKAVIAHNPNPLALYVFTNDKQEADDWINTVPYGGGCINNASWHLTNHHLPFGGRGYSGIGAYHGKYSFKLFSHSKSVMHCPTWFNPAIKHPPFTGKLGLFKKIIR